MSNIKSESKPILMLSEAIPPAIATPHCKSSYGFNMYPSLALYKPDI